MPHLLPLVLPYPVDSYGLTEEKSPRSAERRCEPGYYCVGGVKESCTPGHWGLGGEITSNCSGLCNLGQWCSRILFTYIHTYVHVCPQVYTVTHLYLSFFICFQSLKHIIINFKVTISVTIVTISLHLGYYCPRGSSSPVQVLCGDASRWERYSPTKCSYRESKWCGNDFVNLMLGGWYGSLCFQQNFILKRLIDYTAVICIFDFAAIWFYCTHC